MYVYNYYFSRGSEDIFRHKYRWYLIELTQLRKFRFSILSEKSPYPDFWIFWLLKEIFFNSVCFSGSSLLPLFTTRDWVHRWCGSFARVPFIRGSSGSSKVFRLYSRRTNPVPIRKGCRCSRRRPTGGSAWLFVSSFWGNH